MVVEHQRVMTKLHQLLTDLGYASVLALWGAPMAHAETASCTSVETTVFACRIGKKSVSVCAAQYVSATNGHIQYKYSDSSGKAELIYPNDQRPPGAIFRFSDVGSGAKGSLSNLQFTADSFTYTVYRHRHAIAAYEYAGIAIRDVGGNVTYLKCQPKGIKDGLQKLAHIGLLELPEQSVDWGSP